MARYIDADKLKQNLAELYDFAKWDHRELHFSLFDMFGNIDGEPTADVAPVILALWEAIPMRYEDDDPYQLFKCSNCDYETHTLTNYCPFCGASMGVN